MKYALININYVLLLVFLGEIIGEKDISNSYTPGEYDIRSITKFMHLLSCIYT